MVQVVTTIKTQNCYSVDFSGGDANYTWVSDLPASADSAVTTHHVRVVNHDYNEDGNADVIVFSRTDGGTKLN